MKVLLWTHSNSLDSQISGLVSATGAILFREADSHLLAEKARKEQPLLILLAPGENGDQIKAAIEEIASHPDTRWIPTILLAEGFAQAPDYSSLLDRGADTIIDCGAEPGLLQAQFRALKRRALRLASLRSTRLTDEKTGFYHQSFLLDQLEVLCRKKRRDGIPFCILFLELRGAEEAVHRGAQQLSNTVRGADLFGRWDSQLFVVLLPSSQPAQAHLLAKRCQSILGETDLQAKAALVSSDSGAVEAEAFVEAAHNTLDGAWEEEEFLWRWDGEKAEAQAEKLA